MRRHAVDFVIRSHHADRSGFVQDRFEGIKESLAEYAHRHIRGRAVHARFRLPVAGKVLKGCDDALLVAELRITLEASHGSDAEPRNQIRIFAISFLHATPTRIARHIHDRRQGMVGAAEPGLFGRHREKRLDQFRIERRSQRDGLGETRAINGRMAMQTLLVKNHRDSQAAVLDEELLDRVGEFRHAARVLALARVAGAADLAQSAAILKCGLGLLQIKIAFAIDQGLWLLLPDTEHLCGFFLQRHAREQISHSVRSGQRGILVGKSTRL